LLQARYVALTLAATRNVYSGTVRAMQRDARLRSLVQAHDIDKVTNWHWHIGRELSIFLDECD
jgi:hypothetical protein